MVGFLTFTLCLGFAAITLATQDPSVAVVPDYYQKALAWDETEKLRRDSEALGWAVQTSVSSKGVLHVDLRDADGRPVEITNGSIEIFRHARANHITKHDLEASAEGAISIQDVITHSGWWTVRLDVTDASGQRYAASSDHRVTMGKE